MMTSQSLKRAWRTFIQGALGVFLLQGIGPLQDIITNASDGNVEIDFDVWYSIAVACIAGGIIALVALLQNWAEDATGHDTPGAPR